MTNSYIGFCKNKASAGYVICQDGKTIAVVRSNKLSYLDFQLRALHWTIVDD